MTKFTPEMIEKAKTTKSVEELLALAKENSIELTTEEAKAYFEQLNPKSGELPDDELDNVVGGISDERYYISEGWYYTFNPSRDQPNYTMYRYTEPTPTIAVIGNVERVCSHCKKVTVFNIPEQGPDYCSVCNNVYDGPVID